MQPIEGFENKTFTHDQQTRTVYWRGQGPGVVIMHEIPGITPQVRDFARRVSEEGFRVALPLLFGTPEKPLSLSYAGGQMLRACISREFSVLAANQASPITEWLRALCRAVHAEAGGRGVGAIGMCLTGNFALALMMEPSVLAPVLSQPSLPFPLGATRRAGLHVSDTCLAEIKRRVSQEGAKVLGMRFTHDPACPGERFARLRQELGAGFEGIEIDSGPKNPHHIKRSAHSVVTTDLIDQAGHPTRAALERVLSFFKERLCEPSPAE
jgi:dienelactone hydrolase